MNAGVWMYAHQRRCPHASVRGLVYVYTGAYKGQKKGLDPLKPEPLMVKSYSTTGNWIWILCKKGQVLLTPELSLQSQQTSNQEGALLNSETQCGDI